ncbi:MAG: hypothetical protein KA313_02490 [Pseudarcicella sp.]|nr:hypothetical protein [Pseudarcicella sp.]MBP6409947.1 hypothetical protein [Pseudarcicella sp.]
MPTGFVLPDGTRAFAKKVGIGDASLSPTLGHSDVAGLVSGEWNNPTPAFGGTPYNGSAITGYDSSYYANGTVDERLFTRVSYMPSSVANGNTLAYRNAVGYRIWFSRAISFDQFLFLDIDGGDVRNSEWLTAFGYNGNTRVMPSNTSIYTGTTPAPEVIIRSDTAVNNTWNTLIDNEIGVAADNFNTTGTNLGLKIIKTVVFSNTGNNNPSDLQNQALFNFNEPISDFFVLTGNQGNTSSNTIPQNSAISPLSFTIYVDGGDAPDSYSGVSAVGGPTHGISNYVPGTNTSSLSIGSNISLDTEIIGLPDTFDDGLPAGPPAYDVTTNSYTLPSIEVKNDISPATTANLQGWVDWNMDGKFQANEFASVSVPSGGTTATLSWSNIPPICGNTTTSTTFLRLRISTNSKIDSLSTTDIDERSIGGLLDGEVEDYPISFTNIQACPVANPNTDVYVYNVPKVINVLGDDIAASGKSLTSVSIVGGTSPDAEGDNLTKVVPGEGTWTVNPTSGEITFTHESGFRGNPTPIEYTFRDLEGNVSNVATITLTDPTPVLVIDDTKPYKFTVPKTVDVLANDTTGAPLDASRVRLILSTSAVNPISDAQGDLVGFTVPGEGDWSVNQTTGAITFTPASGFVSNPTPISYQSRAIWSTLSDTATVTLLGTLATKLLYFGAKPINAQNELNWIVSSESNTMYFEVQKSLNGVDFEKTGTINANFSNKYRFLDLSNGNLVYYRLKMIDSDGVLSYSKTILLENLLDKNATYVYPSTVVKTFKVKLDKGELPLNATLKSVRGENIKTFSTEMNEFDVSEIPTGAYLVQILTTKNRKITLKLFKK